MESRMHGSNASDLVSKAAFQAQSLAERCRAAFNPSFISQGEQLFLAGRTALIKHEPLHAHVHVARTVGSRSDVCVDFKWRTGDSSLLQCSCDCRMFDLGIRCEHVWAA